MAAWMAGQCEELGLAVRVAAESGTGRANVLRSGRGRVAGRR